MYSNIDDTDREMIIERYVYDIVGRLNFIDVKEHLKDCLLQEKSRLNNYDLEAEIMRHDPSLLTDIYIEQMVEEVYHAEAI
jgi:hypothetical protein